MMFLGTVTAPRPGGAWIRLVDGTRTTRIYARDTLNVRPPIGSTVLVARTDAGRYRIVGRERA